jgi:MFS family permease
MTAADERVLESEPREMPPEQAGQLRLLRGNPALRKLVAALFLLQVGQSTTWVGVPLLVIERYGLGFNVGLTTGMLVMPSMLLGVAAGNLVDRGNPRKILIVSAVFSGLLVTLFPGTDALWQIQALAILVGIGYMFVMPAVLVVRPQVMAPGSELAGNGLVVSAQRLALLLGPTASGPVIGLAGLRWVFVFEAITAIAAAGFLIRLRIPAPASRPASGPASAGKTLAESVRNVTRLVMSDRKLAAMTVTVFTYVIAYGLGNLLLASYSLDVFHRLPGVLGYLLGALGVGGAAGALLAPRLNRFDRGLVYVCAAILEGVIWAFVPSVDAVASALLLLFMAGLLESTATVVFFAEVQPRLTAEYTGRYWAIVIPGTDACLLIGRALGGFVIPQVGLRTTALIACLIFTCPIIVLAKPLLRREATHHGTASQR